MSWLIIFIVLAFVLYCVLPSVVIKNSETAGQFSGEIFNDRNKYYYWTGILLFALAISCVSSFNTTAKEQSAEAVDIEVNDIVKGINISNNDGNVDLSTPAQDGCKYVYMKATEGATFEDSYMDTYYKECKKIGLKVGAYHYLVSTSTPEEQAENFYEMINKYDWDLIPMLDVEVYFDGVEDYIERFKTAFNKLSPLELGMYSYTSFINSHFTNASPEIYDMPLWEANYNGKPWDGVGNNNFTNLVGHQYSTEKHIKEYLGNFHGDINEFNEGCLINKSSSKNT